MEHPPNYQHSYNLVDVPCELQIKRHKISYSFIQQLTNCSSLKFTFVSSVRNLGITSDPHVSFSAYNSNISCASTCFMHSHDLHRTRSSRKFKTIFAIDKPQS